MRRAKSRDEYIADVVAAWNAVQGKDKPDLMLQHPDLYFAVAWLAAHETVTNEQRARMRHSRRGAKR